MAEFLILAALFVLGTVAAGLLRLLYGPHREDRIMAAQLLGSGGIAILLLVGSALGMPAAVDVALTLALLAAFASAAFVRAATEPEAAIPNGDAES